MTTRTHLSIQKEIIPFPTTKKPTAFSSKPVTQSRFAFRITAFYTTDFALLCTIQLTTFTSHLHNTAMSVLQPRITFNCLQLLNYQDFSHDTSGIAEICGLIKQPAACLFWQMNNCVIRSGTVPASWINTFDIGLCVIITMALALTD